MTDQTTLVITGDILPVFDPRRRLALAKSPGTRSIPPTGSAESNQ
jgi:hypothetical protein